MSRSEYHRGKYEPINKQKYIGKKIPTYRSGWEKEVCIKFDQSPFVVEWASEPFAIQYRFIDPSTGIEKWSLYVPDYYAKMNTNRGVVRFLIEVKPYKQSVEPVPPKKRNPKALRRYDAEKVLYAKNSAKWHYAKLFCKANGLEFKILTEKDMSFRK
jgi:hypothetical protein